jgi:hypothetical protein
MKKYLIAILIFVTHLLGIVVPLFFYGYIYLALFKGFEFYWLTLLVIPIWFFFTYTSEKLNQNKVISDTARTMFRIGSGFAWIWMASIPASIYFLVAALFMNGSWGEFFYAALVGAFMKAVAKEYLNETKKP